MSRTPLARAGCPRTSDQLVDNTCASLCGLWATQTIDACLKVNDPSDSWSSRQEPGDVDHQLAPLGVEQADLAVEAHLGDHGVGNRRTCEEVEVRRQRRGLT